MKIDEDERTSPVASAPPAPTDRTENVCCWVAFVIGVSLVAALVAVMLTKEKTEEVTVLRHVYVLVSHGKRTPSKQELEMRSATAQVPVFAPYGAGALTNEGKRLIYEMGASLRRRYNEFLGPYYAPENSSVITSDTSLSKSTILLVTAGLWVPPEAQKWNDTISWQPVPYRYPKKDQDILLYEENCPKYEKEKQKVLELFINKGALLPYNELLQRISSLTSKNFSTPQQAYYLHKLFLIQDDINVANPKWPMQLKKKLGELAKLEFTMKFYNKQLIKLSGGALLQRIIEQASRSARNETGKRVTVRTGTPEAVAALLAASVSAPPRLPDPGATIIFELHESRANKARKVDSGINATKRFGFKIYYWDDNSAEPRLTEVPKCGAFCPLEKFIELTKEMVTSEYVKECRI